VEKLRQPKKSLSRIVDAAVKTLYSLSIAPQGTTHSTQPKEPIVITRPNATTSSTRFVVRVAFAHAASMGVCALATGWPQLRTNADGGRAHPGMEDV
jgi:hypothetical protein